ncbi:MAG: homogentisate 1,2-dioxygenase [Polyangiaceae bacterium]
MIERVCAGRVPPKPHLVFTAEDGARGYEECVTRAGFEGPYSILYHRNPPHHAKPATAAWTCRAPVAEPDRGLLRRHYRCLDIGGAGPGPIAARVPILFNEHIVLGFARPTGPDLAYFVNGDGDDLVFVHQGAGVLRSVFGDLRFQAGDYVYVPKGVVHRFVPAEIPQSWLSLECKSGFGIPSKYRNAVGQLRMDAPYSHRDFRKPEFVGPVDEGIRDVVVKRDDTFFGFRSPYPPLDVLGWDGWLYPFAFPILAFQPRVGPVHLPPNVHATFEASGALICSFVPRPLDFHPEANPCPFPHSSVDVDEVLFYANGSFASRRGIGEGSLSHHPAGIAHGPHPGAYEAAPGKTHTEELAVMIDCAKPLRRTPEARAVEDLEYHASFASGAA